MQILIMDKLTWTMLTAVITVCLVSSAAGTVSAKDCAGGQCPDIDHAECGTANKCTCSDGYREDGDNCVIKKVSETDCTKDLADQCKHTTNAECNNAASDAKCKCSDGFAEDARDGNTCVKILGGDCPSTVTCADTDNAECSEGKCICSNAYEEKNNICVLTVEGTTCKDDGNECDNIKNTHCDNLICKCDAGYVMNVNVCTADSAAPMVQFGWITILLGVLTIALLLF